MDAAVIVTYRCNAKCAMCNTWQFQTRPEQEITLETIDKLPNGIGRCNITGGEPMLRKDIEDIVGILSKKAERVEISTNGYFTDRILKVAEKYPNLTIRVSVEGLPTTNDKIRGINHGFDHALKTILGLKDLGLKDIGFATVIQDGNAKELPQLFQLIQSLDVEFAQAVPHNSFYFHKDDNNIEDPELVADSIKRLMSSFLDTSKPKLWFRAYLNKGFVDHVRGAPRVLPCTAGSDIFFLDPFGEMYPCNAMEQSMGNLNEISFDKIWNGQRANEIRAMVETCPGNCWMTGTAVPTMKRNFTSCLMWVGKNKFRRMLGQDIILEG